MGWVEVQRSHDDPSKSLILLKKTKQTNKKLSPSTVWDSKNKKVCSERS